MSAKIILFEKADSKAPALSTRTEETSGNGSDHGRFFDNFELLSVASGAIERLRGLILDLAMRGVLTSGTRRLRSEGNSLGPFNLPSGWAWTNLGTLADLINGDRSKNYPSKQYQVCSGVPFINAGHLQDGGIDLAEMNFITEEHFDLLRAGKVQKNDILYCLRGSLGKAAIVREIDRGAIASSLVIIRLRANHDPSYVYAYLVSPLGLRMIQQYDNGTAQPNLSAADVAKFPVPVPPLAEQKRIVAKVDQLMALCDDLEDRQSKKRETGTRFAKSTLEALTSADGPEDFDTALKRCVENFEVLFSAPAAIVDLRRVVLELAMRGRLTGRVSSGPKVSELVSHAMHEAASARDATRGRRSEPIRVVDANEHPPLPEGWIAVRWAQVGLCQNGRAFPSGDYSNEGVRLLRPGNIHISGAVVWTSDNTRYLPTRYAERFPEFIVRGDELVMNLTAQSLKDEFLGRVSMTQAGEECLLNQRLARLTPFAFDPRFLLWFFRCPFFRRYVDGLNQGTLIQHMFTKQVDDAIVFVPPMEEQRLIATTVERLMRVCDDLEIRLRRSEDRASKLVEAVVQEFVA